MTPSLSLFGYNFGFVKIPALRTTGITNECTEDYGFKLYQDYDGVEYGVVRRDIEFLMKEFGLCTFVVLVTSERVEKNIAGESVVKGNYLVFGLDVLSFWGVHEARYHTRGDMTHKIIPLRISSRRIVNRIMAKGGKPMPVLKEVFHAPGCERKHCAGLKAFFEQYGIILKLKNLDKCRTVEIINYGTSE